MLWRWLGGELSTYGASNRTRAKNNKQQEQQQLRAVGYEGFFLLSIVRSYKTDLCIRFVQTETQRADFLHAVYFRQGLTCTIGLTNDLIDGGPTEG